MRYVLSPPRFPSPLPRVCQDFGLEHFCVQVKKVLRQQQVKPHWMFALDNLLRQAVQEALTVLLPGRVSSRSAQDVRIILSRLFDIDVSYLFPV